jgi:hypothetical protein
MLDNPDKATKLLAALKAAVPFEVELTEWLVKQFRAQHHAGADQKHHTVSARGTRCLPDPSPRATCHAACRSHCRLSEASSEKTQEARTALNRAPFARQQPLVSLRLRRTT